MIDNSISNNNKANREGSELYIKTMIKILFVSIIIMLNYEYGLKKSVSILQKRNYAPKEIKTLASLEF